MIEIATARLLLREHRSDDLPALHAMLSDPAVTHYLPGMHHEAEEETAAYLRAVIHDVDVLPRMRYNLAVETKDGALAGCVSLHYLDGPMGRAHWGLGYLMRADLWNQGLATEAVGAALAFILPAEAFRVSASCLAENIGSRRVLEKCGLRQEALLEKHTWLDGEWRDCAIYRILSEETSLSDH